LYFIHENYVQYCPAFHNTNSAGFLFLFPILKGRSHEKSLLNKHPRIVYCFSKLNEQIKRVKDKRYCKYDVTFIKFVLQYTKCWPRRRHSAYFSANQIWHCSHYGHTILAALEVFKGQIYPKPDANYPTPPHQICNIYVYAFKYQKYLREFGAEFKKDVSP
jgi:hypothetical protein